jgi:hypothetical protein
VKKWETVLKTTSGVFATIPGLAILITNIGVPPGCSKYLFAGIIESLGIFTLLILRLNSSYFIDKPTRIINRLALTSIFIFFISLLFYLFLTNEFVITYKNFTPVFFPFFPQGELKQALEKLGSKADVVREWGSGDLVGVIRSSSSLSLTFTMLIFLFVYQLMFVSLTFAFGLLSMRVSLFRDQ